MKQYFGSLSMIALCLFLPQKIFAGKGFMGGAGDVTVNNLIPPPTVEASTDEGGLPETVTGPLNDNKSSSGQLFGDLYKLLRYQGHETTKKIPEVDASGNPICKDSGGSITSCANGQQKLVEVATKPIGGEPILSSGYGIYAKEVTSSTGEVSYVQAFAPYPSQCVQPTANYEKWGDIRARSGAIIGNTLPLIMLYDSTWGRTECAVGQLLSSIVNPTTGELINEINEYFIQPGETYNGLKYCEGVKWIDMVEEVDFGRLNLSRSPEAVLQAAFDEAINAINNSISISLDPAGRLLLETIVYSDTDMTTTTDGCAIPVSTAVFKAIDSPLENLALYVKLIKDGHLITAGDERAPIDRSEYGGIPLWKMLELTDGPSTALRPTVDISKLNTPMFQDLIVPNPVPYYTYYQCYDDGVPPQVVTCLCDISQPDGSVKTGMCPGVATRKLIAAASCPADTTCEYTSSGITTDISPSYSPGDFKFAAAFFAAAADKTGAISADMVVYINSILGINKVIGYSAYDSDGNPAPGAVNYSVNPVYFNFAGMSSYDRSASMNSRGTVTVLQGATPSWTETPVAIANGPITFRNLMLNSLTYLPNQNPAGTDILGFTQMADDNLRVINFIHTYQIPSLR